MKRSLILLTGLFLLSSSAWSAGTLKVATLNDETVELAIPSAEGSPVQSGYWILVTRPKYGEKWTTGKTYTINWLASHYAGKVRVYLDRNGKYYRTLGDTANDGAVAWKVPSNIPAGTGYRIVVQSHILTDVYDFSSWFTIQKASSSSGGYKICKTGSKKIKWSSKKMYYYVNTKGGPSGALGAIKRGASVWNRVKGSSFKFIYRGRTTSRSHGKYDGRNIVSFGPLKTGVLGVNVYIYYTNNGAIVDSDIRFNTRERWSTKKAKNAYDLQSVAAHEFGHSLCLLDLYGAGDKSKTMYGYGSRGDFKQRTLHPADKRGIQALY